MPELKWSDEAKEAELEVGPIANVMSQTMMKQLMLMGLSSYEISTIAVRLMVDYLILASPDINTGQENLKQMAATMSEMLRDQFGEADGFRASLNYSVASASPVVVAHATMAAAKMRMMAADLVDLQPPEKQTAAPADGPASTSC